MKCLALTILLTAAATAQTSQDAHKLYQKALKTGINGGTRGRVTPLLERAAKIWQTPDPLNPECALALDYIGMLHESQAKGVDDIRTKVEPLYSKAVQIYDQKADSVDPPNIALALELEAAALDKLDDTEGAKSYQDRALKIRQANIEQLQETTQLLHPADVHKIGPGIHSPTLIYAVQPEYTDFARLVKRLGTAVLNVVVTSDGLPRQIRVIRALGLGLDEQALRAIQRWRFRPGADTTGNPVAVMTSVEVHFRLL